jgi:hypothetical protein
MSRISHDAIAFPPIPTHRPSTINRPPNRPPDDEQNLYQAISHRVEDTHTMHHGGKLELELRSFDH